MSWIRRLTNLVRSNRHARDLDRELAFHLQERADDFVAAGMTPEHARVEARRRFGNYGVQKEKTRDADIVQWLDSVIDDVRYATRMLRNSPAFAVVAVSSLALGIGANTAIFTIVNAVMLRSLPVAHPEQIVTLRQSDGLAAFTNPVWEQIRDNATMFDGALAFSTVRFNLASSGEVQYIAGSLVSGDYFRTLGLRPALGRLLTVNDDQRGCQPLAVISHDYWQSAYAADAGALGRTISLNGHPFQIVGVVRPGFSGLEVGRATQVFAPLCSDLVLRGPRNFLDQRTAWWLTVLARSKPGFPPDQLQNALNALGGRAFAATVPPKASEKFQREYRQKTLKVEPAPNGVSDLREQYHRALVTLMVIVGMVLVIACANVANLLLARAAVRQREMGIRVALGAASARVFRQLVTESVLLSLLGAALGLVFARWGSRLLVGLLSTSGRPIALDLTLDYRVLGFSVAVAVLTGLAFGLAPAWRSARVAPNFALKASGRGIVEGGHRLSLGKALVIAQIAISLTLIVGAGLLLGTFRRLATLDAGFNPADVLLVSLNQARSGAPVAERLAQKNAVLNRIRALPGITSASLSEITPLGNSSWNEEMVIEGFSPKSDLDGVAYFNQVSDRYFKTLGTSLIVGRDFDARDRLEAPPVAIVNETMARHFYGAANPVGRTFRYRVGKTVSPPIEIIGVAGDAKYQSLREKTLPTAFLSISQDSGTGPDMYVEARIPTGPVAAIPLLRSALADINPLFQTSFVPFATQVRNSLTAERLLATLSGFFGTLALVLATIGLYGVMSYSVARRQNEIGIRMALGAGERRMISMVLGEVGTVVALGFVFGIAGSLAASRLIASFLYGLTPTDAPTFGGSIGLLASAAMLAAYLPARRASRVDPMEALREE